MKIKLPGYIGLLCCMVTCFCVHDLRAQLSPPRVRIMAWNLLNFPSTSGAAADSTNRCPYYRTVVNYVNPDILVTEENSTTYSTTWFLNQVMNSSGNTSYRQGTFIRSYDSSNGIFYRDSLFRFVQNVPIETDLRDISEFTLVHKQTGDSIRIYAVHLKASSGTSEEQQRASEVDSLRKVTNRFRTGTEFIVCGDFNIYNDQESAYQKLLQDNVTDDGNFVDPFTMHGTWNNPSYSDYHTQSTRLNSVGGGAYGGMNDRFDMILMSKGVMADTGFKFIPGTMTAVGNDGQHFDESINYGTNNAVPSNVADALYWSSDHLPVYAEFLVGSTSGIEEESMDLSSLVLYPNPISRNGILSFNLKKAGTIQISLLNSSGQLVQMLANERVQNGQQDIPINLDPALSQGFYILSINTGNSFIYRKLSIFK